jgi:hypothetical protein
VSDTPLPLNPDYPLFPTFGFALSHRLYALQQDAQKVRPARPQAKQEPEAYPLGYVEDSCELRTPLAAFFSILLVRLRQHRNDA